MYVPKNKYKINTPEIQNIAVEWKNGVLGGFRTQEDAERYINHVCKKAAPDMDYSISSYILKRHAERM